MNDKIDSLFNIIRFGFIHVDFKRCCLKNGWHLSEAKGAQPKRSGGCRIKEKKQKYQVKNNCYT